MTDNEGYLTIYGHRDNLLNNNGGYLSSCEAAEIQKNAEVNSKNCYPEFE